MPNVEGVLELYKQFNVPQLPESGLMEKIRALLNNPDYYLITVEEDDKVIGTAMAVRIRNLVGSGRDEMMLENIIVDRDYQKRGIGRILLQEAELFAKKHDCRKIIIVSNRSFGAAGFYQSLGYEHESSNAHIKRL